MGGPGSGRPQRHGDQIEELEAMEVDDCRILKDIPTATIRSWIRLHVDEQKFFKIVSGVDGKVYVLRLR